MKRLNFMNSMLLLLGTGIAGLAWAGDPVTWGSPSGANGCAVLLEHERFDVNSSHEDTGTVAKSHFELSVLTSTGHALPRTTWPDDQASMSELQQIAIADQMRLVKLTDPYTAEDLEYAQSFCNPATTSTQ